MKKIWVPLFCLIIIVGMISGCVEEKQKDESKNIIETVMANEDLSTFANLLSETSLNNTLSNESAEFTVFAPTDGAFDKLDSVYLTNLVENDTSNLTKILTYHVIPGKVMSTDISDGMRIETLQGKYIDITIENGTVYINDAMVTTADIECNNGVIHVIDTVLMPKDNIVETAEADEDLATFVTAIIAADLVDTLNNESAQYTVFAPTDDAFAELDEVYLNNLINNDTENLTTILTYHVLPGIVRSTDLSNNMTATTLEGTNITVRIENSTIYIDDGMITTADIECSNGIIHIIDTVIIP